MKNKDFTLGLGVIALIAIIVAVYLYFENQKSKEKIEELEEDNLKLILDSLKNSNFSDEVKQQIIKLIDKFKDIDVKMSNELAQALQLIQIGQVENAIEDLVKIMEHLLNTHYTNNRDYKEWLKNQQDKKDTLHNKLGFCKHEKKINEIEHSFFIAIKNIRNKEDHTLDLQLDEHLSISGLMAGIWGIIKLSEIVYEQSNI